MSLFNISSFAVAPNMGASFDPFALSKSLGLADPLVAAIAVQALMAFMQKYVCYPQFAGFTGHFFNPEPTELLQKFTSLVDKAFQSFFPKKGGNERLAVIQRNESPPVADSMEKNDKAVSKSRILISPPRICINPRLAAGKVSNLCEDIFEFCKGTFGYSRHEMPQLNGRAKQNFLDQYPHVVIKMDANSLIPMQGEINSQIVLSIIYDAAIEGAEPCGKEFILVAIKQNKESGRKEIYVVDGHHRWAACKILHQEINAYGFVVEPKTILRQMLDSPYSARESF